MRETLPTLKQPGRLSVSDPEVWSLSVKSVVSGDQATPLLDDATTLQVIVNPASGNGRAMKQWPAISAALLEHGLAHRVEFTTGPDDATQLARAMAMNGAQTIVAVGGDGTVNEIINGMIANGELINPDTRLMIIPAGTGKDLGRTVGTGRIERAIKAHLDGSHALIDLGQITYHKDSGEEVTRYFANVADLGLGATVAARINRSSKRLGGLLTYLLAAVRTIIAFQPTRVRVDVEGETIYDATANMVVMANARFFAGGMRVAPDASLCDGLLELFILTDVGKRALLTKLLPAVYRGKHIGHPGVLHVRARTISVTCPDGMLLEMDGEQVGNAPVSVEVKEQILPVVMSAESVLAMSGSSP